MKANDDGTFETRCSECGLLYLDLDYGEAKRIEDSTCGCIADLWDENDFEEWEFMKKYDDLQES